VRSDGLPDPTAPGAVGPPLWIDLPAECPTCGAAVDQASACRAADPRCPFCRGPLPCRPIVMSDVPPLATAPPARPSGTSNRFSAVLHLLTKAEGGRHTPTFDGYRPQIVLAGVTSSVTVTFAPLVLMGVPGEDIVCSIDLPGPVALHAGQTFDVLEGDRVVGRGTVRGVL